MPSKCQHIYGGAALSGFSGKFSPSKLELLIHACLPPGSVLYHEEDAAVIKAEDIRKQRTASQQRTATQKQQKPNRRLRQAPKFEQNSAVDGSKLNLSSISGGLNIIFLGEKLQSLPASLWNLDCLDEPHLPLDRTYTFGSAESPGIGAGVTIYVLDTGIMPNHQEF